MSPLFIIITKFFKGDTITMAGSSLKAFMRNKAKEEEVVKVYAPESFVDENGKRIELQVKRLSVKHINEIYERYNHSVSAKDDDGNVLIRNNRVVKDFVSDMEGYTNRLIVDGLVYPDLHDSELMSFYGCADVMDMPHAVFASKSEYEYVRDIVISLACTLTGEENEYIINEAKN